MLAGVAGVTRVTRLENVCRTRLALVCFWLLEETWRHQKKKTQQSPLHGYLFWVFYETKHRAVVVDFLTHSSCNLQCKGKSAGKVKDFVNYLLFAMKRSVLAVWATRAHVLFSFFILIQTKHLKHRLIVFMWGRSSFITTSRRLWIRIWKSSGRGGSGEAGWAKI